MKRTVFLSCVVLLVLFVIARGDVLAQEHSVISKKPYYLVVGETANEYSNFTDGYALISWKESTPHGPYGFFYAKAVVGKPKPVYEFILVAINNSARDRIDGLFNIYKDGLLVYDKCAGELYAIELPVGEYFKLYITESRCNAETQWHFSAYIDYRFDRP